MTNSRQKGAKGEREFAKLARSHGFDAYRSQQFSGHKEKGDPDVVIKGLHPEIKRREKLDLDTWLAQAKSECKDGAIPIVAHRKNNEKWKVTMGADDFFKLYREYFESHELEG